MGATKSTTDETCAQPSIKVHHCVSILPNDYAQLVNLPTINSITLSGNLSSSELNLLSSAKDDYEDTTLESAQSENGYIVVLLPDSQPKCLSLSYIYNQSGLEIEGGFVTVDGIDTDTPVGTYQFVEIKEGD